MTKTTSKTFITIRKRGPVSAIVATVLGCLTTGFCIGWMAAHIEVKNECTLIGRFYVGHTVYACRVDHG
jgi:hypothetical protein